MKVPWSFMRYLPIARTILAKGRLPFLLLDVARKRQSSKGLLAGFRDDLKLLMELCVAWWKGEYRAISTSALVAVVAALLYFVSPLDAIPDWLPGMGFLDDAAVLTWLMRKWSTELEAFRRWRAAQSPQTIAELDRLPPPDEPAP
ncbi:YkvA family protein [Stutzerimonas urumqiensis]|uniref:YkvA family protein n=1 Tax=Stutzerimonas urumqiensis TaxID=638269 RepID=UPI000EAE4C7F|nr:DUF1232 domain-containing protein [Stutzerimonas urumqiensis]